MRCDLAESVEGYTAHDPIEDTESVYVDGLIVTQNELHCPRSDRGYWKFADVINVVADIAVTLPTIR